MDFSIMSSRSKYSLTVLRNLPNPSEYRRNDILSKACFGWSWSLLLSLITSCPLPPWKLAGAWCRASKKFSKLSFFSFPNKWIIDYLKVNLFLRIIEGRPQTPVICNDKDYLFYRNYPAYRGQPFIKMVIPDKVSQASYRKLKEF